MKISTETTNIFDCSLVSYATLWSNKVMWGMDCDIEPLLLEIYKLYTYSKLTNIQETSNTCTKISPRLLQKVQQYKKALERKQTSFCRNC